MKLISKLGDSGRNSIYSGATMRSYELNLKPVPATGEDGKPLPKSKRYYVFRLLYFTETDRDTAFIVRNEHCFYRKDVAGNVKEIKRICCPTTQWARRKINDVVDKDYCPICKYSADQNAEGWKNYRTLGQRDDVCLDMSKATKRVWAAYIPVYVVSDPNYSSNNNHFRILRLAGDSGMKTFNELNEVIRGAEARGLTVFNGEEGANIAFLCERVEVEARGKNGEVQIDKRTGAPRTYMSNQVTDIYLMDKKLYYYPNITEENLEKLRFDETYATAATKDQLSAFLNENFLDNGASDDDFGEDEFSTPSKPEASPSKASSEPENDDFADADEGGDGDDEDAEPSEEHAQEEDDDEFAGESPRDAIARITKGRVSTSAPKKEAAKPSVKKDAPKPSPRNEPKKSEGGMSLRSKMGSRPTTEQLREDSLTIDPDDLPF